MDFRTLTADEIELRVGTATPNGFSLLLYKDARCDMQLLDETVGSMDWQRTHEVVDGRLCCTVSVWDAKKSQWISKQDVGTESQTEKDKGQFSDSFKRACVNLGIGRELYSAPFIWIKGHMVEDKKARSGYKPDPKFVKGLKVSAIEYSKKRTITKLVIEDNDGDIVFEHGTKSVKKTSAKKAEPKNVEAPKGEPIKPTTIISAEHAEEIKRGLEETDSKVDAFLSLFRAKSVDTMYESQYELAMEKIEKKRQKLKGGK